MVLIIKACKVIRLLHKRLKINFLSFSVILGRKHPYCIAGLFGGVNAWRIAELKVIGEIKFGKWIDFGHKDTIY